jgi:hypothetical protein
LSVDTDEADVSVVTSKFEVHLGCEDFADDRSAIHVKSTFR